MDWHLAIERNGEALKRILAMLVAMAGLGDGSGTHLPRILYRTVLRLLRPAESAVRRLIVVAARGLTVDLPALRPRGLKKRSAFTRNGGTGIVIPAGYRVKSGNLVLQTACPKPTRLSLPLFDRLPRFAARRATAPKSGVPRISSFGFGSRFPIPVRHPPQPDDPIATARLTLRIEALASALDDLPGQARRFARWRAAQARSAAVPGNRRFQRISALRPGRPPGALRMPTHEVHEVLADLNFFALRALERKDTS